MGVKILVRLRPHIDEASYLYGFTRNLREKLGVTWFLLKKKRTQLRRKVDPRASTDQDALIHLYGARHVVDLLGSEIYVLDEVYRELLYDRVADFVPRAGWTAVDVGANVGMFAIRQARRGAHVYAFEPNPSCYKRLSRAVVENGRTGDVSIFNYAVGQTIGVGALSVPNDRTALGSITSVDAAAAVPPSAVRITSLDSILPALGVERVDLLKVDAEGSELEVLRGASRTLRTTERVVLEYHSRELRGQVSAVLSAQGFRQVLEVDTPAPYLPEAGMIYAARM
jgi:FkbM family methyltransferase